MAIYYFMGIAFIFVFALLVVVALDTDSGLPEVKPIPRNRIKHQTIPRAHIEHSPIMSMVEREWRKIIPHLLLQRPN